MAFRARRAVLALALAVAACGSDDTSSAIDAAVTDGALIVDGPPVDAGPATWDQCTESEPGPLINQRVGSGPAPGFTGGTIVDGRYLLTDYAVYDATTLTSDRPGVAFTFAAPGFQAAANSVSFSGTFTTSGSTLSFSSTCRCGVAGGCQSSLLTTSLEYDATATSLVTSQPYVNGGTVVATYTRQ